MLGGNADNKVKIGAGGGVEAIVQAMGGHCGSKGVQNAGCTALWSLGRSRVRKFGFGNSDYRERERERERERHCSASRGLVRRRQCRMH